ncbi:MAG: hypothetical protein HY931_00740 [Candidatus Falkowbacteria bacterium]|nr:MAG: hypothetical protein HY931_00740 [Candidatus Falkowbacteria bacterium]
MNLLKKIQKKNPNYVLQNRHWISAKRHVPVVLKAAISGALFALAQYYVNYRGLSFEPEAKEAIMFLAMAFSFFVYVIFAGYAINRVLDESKEVSRAIVQKDLDTFLLYRDEQLPILIHLPLGIVSGVIIFFLLFFPFPDEFIGMTSVFAIVFMMSLLFIVTQELDNYENSIWFKAKTPADWWQIDIEKHFEGKSEAQ